MRKYCVDNGLGEIAEVCRRGSCGYPVFAFLAGWGAKRRDQPHRADPADLAGEILLGLVAGALSIFYGTIYR
jgi:hypothetical protein